MQFSWIYQNPHRGTAHAGSCGALSPRPRSAKQHGGQTTHFFRLFQQCRGISLQAALLSQILHPVASNLNTFHMRKFSSIFQVWTEDTSEKITWLTEAWIGEWFRALPRSRSEHGSYGSRPRSNMEVSLVPNNSCPQMKLIRHVFCIARTSLFRSPTGHEK